MTLRLWVVVVLLFWMIDALWTRQILLFHGLLLFFIFLAVAEDDGVGDTTDPEI